METHQIAAAWVVAIMVCTASLWLMHRMDDPAVSHTQQGVSLIHFASINWRERHEATGSLPRLPEIVIVEADEESPDPLALVMDNDTFISP